MINDMDNKSTDSIKDRRGSDINNGVFSVTLRGGDSHSRSKDEFFVILYSSAIDFQNRKTISNTEKINLPYSTYAYTKITYNNTEKYSKLVKICESQQDIEKIKAKESDTHDNLISTVIPWGEEIFIFPKYSLGKKSYQENGITPNKTDNSNVHGQLDSNTDLPVCEE